MFGLFASKKIVSLDIKENYIRFVEVSKDSKNKKVLSYGETISKDGYFKNSVIDENSLTKDLKEIKSKIKTDNFVVVLPDEQTKLVRVYLNNLSKNLKKENISSFMQSKALLNFDEDILSFKLRAVKAGVYEYDVLIIKKNLLKQYIKVFKELKIKVASFIHSGTALIHSCVPRKSESSFMVCSAEENEFYLAMYSEKDLPIFYLTTGDFQEIIKTINTFYIDWYKIKKEKIHNILFAGKKASDDNSIDLISKELKIPIQKANIFVNFNLKKDEISIIHKENSYKYAVAVGAVNRFFN